MTAPETPREPIPAGDDDDERQVVDPDEFDDAEEG